MNVHDVPLLACPDTGHPLVFQGSNLELQVMDGVLVCPHTKEAWTVDRGVARMFRDHWLTGSDAAVARRLDQIPAWIEPLTAATTLLAGGGRMADLRQHVVELLDLPALAGQSRARVLEVGVGTAANWEPLQDNAPTGTVVELWGTDLSIGALRQAAARVEQEPQWHDRLSLFAADPAHLPFQPATFDRVLVCGGFDCFRDPARAMAELVRVVKPGGLVVIVDKQPDPARSSPLQSLVLSRVRADAVLPAEAPVELVPEGCRRVHSQQLTPLHYALTFQPPAG